jgi:hypothetical protein
LLLTILVMLLAGALIGMRCSGSVSGEREKQTWEALLLAPIDTRHLIRGKLWGVMGAVQRYVLVYAAVAVPLSYLAGLEYFPLPPKSTVHVLIMLLVTEMVMFYMAGVGIWCSVKSRGSWRALVGTIGFGYGGGLLLFIILSPVSLFIAGMIFVLLRVLEQQLGLNIVGRVNFGEAFLYGSWALLTAFLIGVPFFCVKSAERWVGSVERTRIWKRWEYDDEDDRPRRRRRRRPASPPPKRVADDDDIPVV